MANPIAITGGDQLFAFEDLPKLVTLDGTTSTDPDGDPITAYDWSLIDKPPTSAAVLDDAADPEPTFTADVPGTYLFFLVVAAGGEDSDSDRTTAPASAYARVTVTTEHRALKLPATGERDWGDRANENFGALDTLGGALDAHAGNQAAHWNKADHQTIGTVQLSDAPAQATIPIALSPTNADWQTLRGGPASDADGLHKHAALADGIAQNANDIDLLEAAVGGTAPGRHHFLRHDLLVGANDRTWDVGDVGALDPSSGLGGDRMAWVGQDADDLLEIDIVQEGTGDLAGAIWPGIAGDFEATIDLRLSFYGMLTAKDGGAIRLVAGFGWMDSSDLLNPRDLRGGGIVVNNTALAAMKLGTTGPAPAVDWNAIGAGALALTPEATVGGLVTELMLRLTRLSGAMWMEASIGGGGFVRISEVEWDGAAGAAGKFCVFGSLEDGTAGMRLKSTGFRIRQAVDKWFGS